MSIPMPLGFWVVATSFYWIAIGFAAILFCSVVTIVRLSQISTAPNVEPKSPKTNDPKMNFILVD